MNKICFISYSNQTCIKAPHTILTMIMFTTCYISRHVRLPVKTKPLVTILLLQISLANQKMVKVIPYEML